jgi:hypothetical protein
MLEHKTILNKIEKLVDQLPYRTAEIRIELPKEILVLTKERQPKPGFDTARIKHGSSK